MLNNHERELFSDVLTLSEGAEVEYVYGATYTLSLEFLMGMLLWLDNNDRDLKDTTPLEILKSLMTLAEKVSIYVQAGNTAPPTRAHSILKQLDEIVKPVKLPDEGAFHPKFIVIKYSSEPGAARFRFVVLSRNFSFSSAWDFIFAVECTASKRETEFGVGLADYLSAIDPKIDAKRLAEMRTLEPAISGAQSANIEKVKFYWQHPGTARNSLSEYIPTKMDACLVVSPFINKWFIEELAKRLPGFDGDAKCLIVSRQFEMDKIDASVFQKARESKNFEFYTYIEDERLTGNRVAAHKNELASGNEDKDDLADDSSDEAVDAESNIRFNPLHAKIYLFQRANQSLMAVGSANATYNGWSGRNSECLVFFETKGWNAKKLWQAMFTKPKGGELHPYIQIYEPRPYEDDEDQDEKTLDEIQKILLDLEIAGTVTDTHVDLQFNNHERIKQAIGGKDFLLELYSLHDHASDSNPLTINGEYARFNYSDLDDVSSFFIGRIVQRRKSGDLSRDVLLKANLNWGNVSQQDRLRAFFRNSVANKQGFFKLLKLLLSGFLEPAEIGASIFDKRKKQGAKSDGDPGAVRDAFSFEDLVHHFSRKNAKSGKVDTLIEWYREIADVEGDAEVQKFLNLWRKMRFAFREEK